MKAIYKDFFRGMRANKGKFISVFFIILLGAAFFSGLRSSRGDMLLSAERYYDANSLADINIVSPIGSVSGIPDALAGAFGLTESDVEDILALPEVESAEGAYSMDVLLNSEDRRAVKLISCSSAINTPVVTKGRLPSADDECLVDSLLLELGTYSIGDSIEFVSGDGTDLSSSLNYTKYTIVGFADLPQYMDLNRGTGTVGNGEIDGFVLIMPQAFNRPCYTQINVLVSGARELDSFESEYDDLISSAEQAIGEVMQSRYDKIERFLSLLPLPSEQLSSILAAIQCYVLDRNVVTSCVSYRNDAERIASLGELLPLVFFLVAALVSLTAMTRMVEEERQQIGTLKALGSSNTSVLVRYLMYALIPTLLGSVIGVLIGEKLFPFAIMNAYAMLYTGLTSFALPYNLAEGAIAVLASVISTGIATIAASINIVRETPSQIMRPEAPKPGKRVLLERVPFVWNRLGFTQKSTVRNLFRNKKRFLMTIIGIAGCMGLVLVGLGLHDSIMVVADMQFTQLTHYQASVSVQESTDGDMEDLLGKISDYDDGVTSFVLYQRSVDMSGQNGTQTVSLSVPQTTDGIASFFTFRHRSGHDAVTLSDGGAIISEKTATTLGVSVGDYVTFRDGDSSEVSVIISDIYENYIGHYVFITQSCYEQIFGSSPSYNLILLQYDSSSEDFQDGLGSMLLENDSVQGVSFTSALVEWADDTLSSLNTIVLIVLAAAALLAFVVLYNLNSINIAERKRELATLKVLGFYDGEVAAYVYKENILLTIIGIAVGIVFGIFLHQYVITSIEVDLIMFGRSIFWYSYLLGALITFGFSAIINFIMYRSIKRIDMIQSLKSVE